MARIAWHGAKPTARHASPLAEHIGRKIFELRQQKQWSMTVASEKCGISKTFFCDMENGKTTPGAETLLSLSIGFNVSVQVFFDGFEKQEG